MIPKIIHYCWFGGKPLPEDAKKCIMSWRKYLPNYEIREWNETNFDLNCCEYIQEAYRAKKWAFVSDYVRFWVLYQYGGLYFDTDVEMIKPVSDLVEKGSFMACENVFNGGGNFDSIAGDVGKTISGVDPPVVVAINPGLGLAAVPGLGLYKEVLDYYGGIHFSLNKEGSYDTIVNYVTGILRKHGFEGNGMIEVIDGIYIYPPEYFCPMNYKTGKVNITKNTYTIHWYTASWQSEYKRFKTRLQHLLGESATNLIIQVKRKIIR